MTTAECKVETIKHIEMVRKYLRIFTDALTTRGVKHDASKLEDPELAVFTEVTPQLAGLTYGTKEYEESLKDIQVALDHHYASNRHHPEHFSKGIEDMTLVDIVEMLCDWKAASLRQHDGNLLKSIELNAQRFGYDDQLKKIFINTAKLIDEE